ncbi:hypothetical protein P691DRAFT_540791 [Macrolepiota fuliginosa MF-IS2]|uniref:Uncharacterized protein n=1 Tax=Macrolepiota fuliginosa MF-IS2 TaxID=1400762 RepID=A0A9P5XHH9_9AGAR|nr:hypothetical protein P691DRAFT_540791 [Macrolepiota fuliginosa MF-IS2]
MSETNRHHAAICHCACHHTLPSQAAPSPQSARPGQPSAPGQFEISQLFNNVQEFFRSLYTPPQIRVSRSGFWNSQSMAFGRQSLANMSYDEAETLFRSVFESEGDRLEVASNEKVDGKNKIKVIPPTMDIHATFLREGKHSTDVSVVLHRSAWPEVVENVKALSIVFRKGKTDEASRL